jgi:REP element-mobilizing transposase RayT
MANTYTQLYVHFVFAVKFRKAQLSPLWDERLRLYITAIVQNNGHKMLAINNMEDHIHIFIGLNPKQSISQLMQLVKGDSSEWVNKQNLCVDKFQWQDGYGAFSYAKSQIDNVVKYIANQQQHHKKENFRKEYVKILDAFDVDYDDRYVFNDLIDG